MVITMAWATLHIGEAMDHLDRFAGDTYVFTAPVAEDRYTLRIGESFIVIQPSKRRSCIVFAHDLKHTGVAFLAAGGVDPSEIARRAGHSSLAFTYDYATATSCPRSTRRPVKLALLRSSVHPPDGPM